MTDVILVTDRAHDLLGLQSALEATGHRVSVAPFEDTPQDGASPEVVLVDAVKDLLRGRDSCRGLRTLFPRLPLLALVAADTLDAIGPDWQIDSFVTEPVVIGELAARIRLVIGVSLVESDETVRVGDLAIDPETYQVRLRGRPLDLTYKEFQLLFYLAQRPGRVFSRQQLLQEVWGYDFFGGTRTVDVHVRRLRAKLGAEHEGMIATIRNVGYKMEAHRTR